MAAEYKISPEHLREATSEEMISQNLVLSKLEQARVQERSWLRRTEPCVAAGPLSTSLRLRDPKSILPCAAAPRRAISLGHRAA